MPKSLRQRLVEKGWSEEEIEKTMHIMFSPEKRDKHAHYIASTHPIIYWVGLFIAIIGNILLSVTLIPFLMILSSAQLYIILGVVGAIFGAMFNHILRDIEHVDEKHHVMAGVFIPGVALITVYMMTTVANAFNEVINNPNPHNAIILSVIYIVCFSAPYFVYKAKDIFHQRRHAPPKPDRPPADAA
ncbi:hypothetical protein KY362_04665 [Candidatus Woesearchaeota archaeon]|nr:hypothetical protein [Candidatus Woesearchaeota archaeon]